MTPTLDYYLLKLERTVSSNARNRDIYEVGVYSEELVDVLGRMYVQSESLQDVVVDLIWEIVRVPFGQGNLPTSNQYYRYMYIGPIYTEAYYLKTLMCRALTFNGVAPTGGSHADFKARIEYFFRYISKILAGPDWGYDNTHVSLKSMVTRIFMCKDTI